MSNAEIEHFLKENFGESMSSWARGNIIFLESDLAGALLNAINILENEGYVLEKGVDAYYITSGHYAKRVCYATMREGGKNRKKGGAGGGGGGDGGDGKR